MSTFEKAAAPHATAPTDFSLSTTSTEKLGFQTKDAAQTLPPQTQTEFAEINKDDLWRAHVHLGHLKNKWNPKMKPFIYGYRYKLHILNWKKIILALDRTRHFFYRLGQEQKKILFVGTKPQAQWVIKTAAQQTFNFYVCNRWLGGTLTNTQTLRKRIKRLWTLAQNFKINALQWFPKQERLKLAKEKTKLEGFFEGIKMMHTQPAVLFVVNPDHEITALKEAKKQGITTVGICDTNSDPTLLDYCIPGNDDSVTSIFTLVQYLVQAYCQGIGLVYERPVIPETELKKSVPLYNFAPYRTSAQAYVREVIVPLHENRNQYLKKAQANYLHDHQDEPKLDLTKIVVCYRPKQRLFRYGVVTPITPAPGQGGAAKTSKVAPEFNLQTVKIVANSVRSSLATLTVPQLKTLCRQTNIQVTAKMVKQDYLDLLVPMLTIKNQHLAVIT